MRTVRIIADRLIGLSATIGAAGLLLEVIIILVDVIGRAFHKPLFGSQDLITMTMVIVVFGAMAICDRRGGNIAIDVFEHMFPDRFNRAMDIISALVGAAIFAMIAWTVLDSAKLSIMLNLSTNLLNLPKAWFQWALAAFAILTAAGMLLRALELAVSGRDVRTGENTA
jgi:TRAP-type C4-dicarboxylate transport system permease small subunit